MLDSAIIDQLNDVFTRLERDVTLAYHPAAHPKQDELVEMLTAVAATSERISLTSAGEPLAVPRFAVLADDDPTGIGFTGVPGGHEFTSLVMAILHAGGAGKRPDDAMLARIRRLRGPIRLRTFISLSCENCPDVVQALNLMATAHPNFTHETVDGEFAASEIEELGIRGVPSVMSNGHLVSSGKASFADLLSRLEDHFGSEASTEAIDLGNFDVAIIGGGPAGASSAIYAARKGLKTVVISDRLGGQLQDTKAIENLISVPYTEGPKLTANLSEHLGQYDINILDHRRVTKVVPATSTTPIELTLGTGETLRTSSLVIATGAKWRELGVDGEREYLGRGVAFCPHCDGPFYKGKDIAVVGGGNSGVEAAIDLAGMVRSLTLVEFQPQLKADTILVDKLRQLPNVEIVTNAETKRIVGDGAKVVGIELSDRETGDVRTIDLNGVFVQIGLVPNSKFLGDLVETNRFGEIIVDDKCRTSRPGIYAAGDVTTVPYKQIVVAVGEGAKAGLAAFEDQLVAA